MRIFLFVFALCFSIYAKAQSIKDFRVSPNQQHLTLKVCKNDTLVVKEDSAFVLSSTSFYAYRYLRDELLKCQDYNEKAFQTLQNSLTYYLKQLIEVDKAINAIDNISDNTLAPIIANLKEVNQQLVDDINKLKGLNEVINEKTLELAKIEKQLKKQRFKQAWLRFGDWIVAGGAGLVIGAILL